MVLQHYHVLHLNVRSIAKHIDDVKNLINDIATKIHIIALTDCWLIKDVNFEIPGYNRLTSRVDRNKASGVLVYLKEGIDMNELYFDVKNTGDCVIVKIVNRSCKNRNVVLCVIYRSPDDPVSFILMVKNLLEYLTTLSKHMIIVGDFNLNYIDYTNIHVVNFKKVMGEYGLVQVIKTPTRIVGGSNTLIDLIFTNMGLNDIQAGNIICDITDHFAGYLNVNGYFENKSNWGRKVVRKVVNYKRISCILASMDFTDIIAKKDINDKVISFVNLLSKLVEDNTQTYDKVLRDMDVHNPWITRGIRKAIRKRNKLSYKSRKNPGNDLLKRTYLQYRDTLSSILYRAKKKLLFSKNLGL